MEKPRKTDREDGIKGFKEHLEGLKDKWISQDELRERKDRDDSSRKGK